VKTIHYLVAGLAVLAMSLTALSSASGRIIESERYHFTDSHIEQEEHGSDFCPNVEFLVLSEVEAEGRLLIKTANGPFPYFVDRFQATESHTNLENSKTLTQVHVTRSADQRIVDNGDGTITITIKNTGRNFVYGPDGNQLFIDAGQTQFQIVIDHNGTPGDPADDEFVADLGLVKLTGRTDTEGRDFCDDLVTFLS
jgi:hypothetical protein